MTNPRLAPTVLLSAACSLLATLLASFAPQDGGAPTPAAPPTTPADAAAAADPDAGADTAPAADAAADTAADPAAATDPAAASDDAAAPAADDAEDPMEIPPSIASAPERDMTIPRGLRVHEPEAFQGYTLFAPLQSRFVSLIDMAGEVVHRWETDGAPGAWVHLLDDGTLLRSGREDGNALFEGGGIGGRIQKLAPDGTILWRWLLTDEQRCQHHVVEPLPGGTLLVIAWEKKEQREALAHGRAEGHVGEKGLWPDAILEVRPTPPEGVEVVWEWHAWDHVVQDMEAERLVYGGVPDHPGRIDVNGDHRDQPPLTEADLQRLADDHEALAALGYVAGGDGDDDADDEDLGGMRGGDWLHTNAVAWHPEHDLLVLSSPRFNELWVIDHSTTTAEAAGNTGGRWGKGGEILWRWGNPKAYGFGDTDDQALFGQHDPTWVPGARPGELRLMVFNNGQDREGTDKSYSSVDELVLPFDPQRGFLRGKHEPFGPQAPDWTYVDKQGFYSGFISGAQRLPNGNTLICSGVGGRIFEVTRDGRTVWEYRNPHGGDAPPSDNSGRAPPLALFRATRLGLDHPGVQRLLERDGG